MTIEQSILRLIFPKKVFEWFDVVESTKDDKEVRIVFEEKNMPPVDERNKNIVPPSRIFSNQTKTPPEKRGGVMSSTSL